MKPEEIKCLYEEFLENSIELRLDKDEWPQFRLWGFKFWFHHTSADGILGTLLFNLADRDMILNKEE